MARAVKYTEPASYFPKELLKKFEMEDREKEKAKKAEQKKSSQTKKK